MTELKALIFDVDGTLAETECDGHRVAFNRAFESFGLPWTWSKEFYGSLLAVGGGKERIKYYAETYASSSNEEWSNLDIPELHQQKNQFYEDILLKGEIPLRPGVVRLFQEAQAQNIRLAIATTSSFSNTLALLKYHLGDDAQSLFSVIGAGDIVSHKKPAPDIYHYVLDELDLPAANCLVFEDSEAGVKAAFQAELSTVMTLNSYTEGHSYEHADLVVNHLGEKHLPCQAIAGSIHNFKGYIDIAACQEILNQR